MYRATFTFVLHEISAVLSLNVPKSFRSDLCSFFPFFATLVTRNFLRQLSFCFKILLLLFILEMASRPSSEGRETAKLILPSGFLKIFASEQFAAKFELFPFIMNKILGWNVHGRQASWGEIEKVLQRMMRECKKESSTSIFSIMDSQLLRAVGTEQVRQMLSALIAEHMYAVRDLCVRQWLFWLFLEKNDSRFF